MYTYFSLYRHCEATVEEAIQPRIRGRVRWRGSWWFAIAERKTVILPGTQVNIIGVRNTTLIVEPIDGWDCWI